MGNLFHYRFMGVVCLLLGASLCFAPLLGVKYNILQTVCFLLGLIGYGLFSGLAIYVRQPRNNAEIDINKSSCKRLNAMARRSHI